MMMVIKFEFTTKYGIYSDAIIFPDDEPMTEEAIEAEKQRRLDNWVAMIEAPIAEEPLLSPEE
jgi:hypothetical protein